ncbi:MAG: NAD(P)-dependent oxidoreductase [Planctomycetota bacterium]
MRILLTTTSYQDTPGPHHAQLQASGFEVVKARGPLGESALLELLNPPSSHGQPGFDGLLCGDDALSPRVIDAALAAPTPLRVISKYGVGLDSIAVDHARSHGLPVLYTPGVNETSVAEHALGLMLAVARRLPTHVAGVKRGAWDRQTGVELSGRLLAILGVGRVGRALGERAAALGMSLVGYGRSWDDAWAQRLGVRRAESAEAALEAGQVVSLHLPLTPETRHLVRAETIERVPERAILINTARGGLVDEAAVAEACRSGRLHGYGADVLEHEPVRSGHVFAELDNVVVTPHIASRTQAAVGRQAVRATTNLIEYLTGGSDYVQA